MNRIELHIPFDQIPQEKKQMITNVCKAMLSLVSSFTMSDATYEDSVQLYFSFVHEFFSIPTILRYMVPLLAQIPVNFNNVFKSYFYCKKADMAFQDQEEQKIESQGNLITETAKDERKMFIFANSFELLHSKLLSSMNAFEIYPVLLVLEATVQHLSRRVLDSENASVDDYIMTTILRNQLRLIEDFKTTSRIFGLVFGESVKSKHSIFEDSFNPQAAITLTKIYSTIMMICRHSQRAFQQIILGIAFNDAVLFKLWKFIDVYCGIDSLLVRNV